MSAERDGYGSFTNEGWRVKYERLKRIGKLQVERCAELEAEVENAYTLAGKFQDRMTELALERDKMIACRNDYMGSMTVLKTAARALLDDSKRVGFAGYEEKKAALEALL